MRGEVGLRRLWVLAIYMAAGVSPAWKEIEAAAEKETATRERERGEKEGAAAEKERRRS